MRKSLPFALLLIVFAAACGGNQAATTPAAIFSSPTPIPFYEYISPTPVSTVFAIISTPTPASGEVLDPQAVTAGQGRYTALTCGTCHGDAAQGTSADGPPLAPMTLSEADFVTYLRSGGKLGSKHQYATNRLSDMGAHNLYIYLKSLGT